MSNKIDLKALAKDKIKAAKDKAVAAKENIVQLKAKKSNPPAVYVEPHKYTGDAGHDAQEDLTALQKGFRKRASDESKRFALATDSEYWACICFQTREQKELFLQALDILKFGDKYLDGQVVAKHLGIELPKADVPYKTSSKLDPAWVEFVDKGKVS